MGQYYKPISLDKLQTLYTHDYGNGLKLMEHSWIGNDFVSVVENLLTPDGDWHKTRIVWAGDYADGELNADGTEKVDAEGREINLYSMFDPHENPNLKIRPEVKDVPKKFKYLCNHTQKVFVDMTKVPCDKSKWHDGTWQVHPLPLLTCEGNGRGGGDYHNDNVHVGTWARDVISLEGTKPKGFKEINPNFVEN
jgi:hypothetical protein